MAIAKANDTVKVHYTGKLTTGEIFDSSVNREPLQFVVGGGQMIKGFDKAVDGMSINEKKTVTIPFDEAYGSRSEELIHTVPREHLPEGMDPQVGQKLIAEGGGGQSIELTVVETAENHIVVDANHMLAGQDLVFEIELVGIN
jgi:FKBP-type peptidyl-prolyl cis-trans isomerase 2